MELPEVVDYPQSRFYTGGPPSSRTPDVSNGSVAEQIGHTDPGGGCCSGRWDHGVLEVSLSYSKDDHYYY